MPEVAFHYRDQIKRAEKSFLLCLDKYCKDYFSQDRIDLNDSCDFGVFCHFIDFLVSGRIPIHKNDQIGVYNLLKEWESSFSLFDSFRFRLSTQEKDGILFYNGQEYRVSIGSLFLHSRVFREFYMNNSEMVFHIDLLYSEESFEEFLDLIHNKISVPKVENAGDVYDICNSLCCGFLCSDSHCQKLDDDSCERVLYVLLRNQNNDYFDLSSYESSVIRNIERYLRMESFCSVSIPLLCRILGSCNQTFSLSSLEPFLIGCMKHHGIGAKILLNNIKYQKPSNLTELNQFLKIMSFENSNDIYDHTNHVLSSFEREFETIKDENRRLFENNQQTVTELKHEIQKRVLITNEIQEKDKIIHQNASDIQERERVISQKANEIQEKDRIISQKANEIQEMDRIINRNKNEIQEMDRIINQKANEIQEKDRIISVKINEIQDKERVINQKINVITDNERIINQKTNEIQEKNRIINEQSKQIKKYTEKIECIFVNDLFSGIFDRLSKIHSINLAESGEIVSVTASSVYDNNYASYNPYNVLKNDHSKWANKFDPNSWIRFDFKQRKVYLTSYSINDYGKIKSWKVEGSQDGLSYENIDNRINCTAFQNSNIKFNDMSSQSNFPVNPTNKYYRYIRIISTGQSWYGNYDFSIIRVEFFGYVD